MTLNYLKANPTEVARTGRLPLATYPVAALITDAEVFVSEARRYLSKEVTVCAFDPIGNETAEWMISPRDWTEMPNQANRRSTYQRRWQVWYSNLQRLFSSSRDCGKVIEIGFFCFPPYFSQESMKALLDPEPLADSVFPSLIRPISFSASWNHENA